VRSKRLEIRATPEQKRLIERAAQLRGTSVTDFVVNKLQEAALEIVQETESIRLREEDRKVFFNALIHPPAPSGYTKAAVARYKKQVRRLLEADKKTPQFFFVPLGSAHDRAAFSCKEPRLENYIKTQARQDAGKKVAAVFVMTVDGRAIAGFYTLPQYTIRSGEIPAEIARRLTKHDQIPAILIGRPARDTAFRGTGAGDLLLLNALQRCLALSGQAASWAIVVEAKNERGTAFYKKFGCAAFLSRPLKLFLPIATIEKMFA
jgi:uncharacterized protein (DUF1778 family)